jgi:hypothetical protein
MSSFLSHRRRAFASAGGFSRIFDGTNDFLTVANDASLNFGDATNDSAFSITAWVKPIDNVRVFTLTMGSLASREYGFGLNASGYLFLQIFDDNSSNNRLITQNTVIANNVWTHIAATYDGRGGTDAQNGMELYINGTLQTSPSRNTTGGYTAMHNQGLAAAIGLSYNDGSNYADSKIADLRVYSEEVSASNISTIESGGSYTTNLVSQWIVNESLDDQAGTNNASEGSGSSTTTSTDFPL